MLIFCTLTTRGLAKCSMLELDELKNSDGKRCSTQKQHKFIYFLYAWLSSYFRTDQTIKFFLSVKKGQIWVFNCFVYSSIQFFKARTCVHGLSGHERTIQGTESLLHTTANSSRDGQKNPKESGSDIKRHTYTTLALHISFTSGRIDLAES